MASDGDALILLQKEFPFLKSFTLPSYNIKYTKSGFNLKLKLLFNVPSIFLAVHKEHKFIQNIIKEEQIEGIISDNRFGVYSNKIPSVYITHQLNVLSGFTTNITSKIHQRIIQKFDECWVPDVNSEINLTGKLGHLTNVQLNLNYIGVLSRMNKVETAIEYDFLALLSGPEPQRTLLEKKLLKELKNHQGKVLFVRGVLNKSNEIKTPKNIEVKQYLLSKELELAIQQSKVIIARSGYSTIMDLAILEKKAFFIPTPGQFEQEYLAKKLSNDGITPFAKQDKFKLNDLKEIEKFDGFKNYKVELSSDLFSIFQSE